MPFVTLCFSPLNALFSINMPQYHKVCVFDVVQYAKWARHPWNSQTKMASHQMTHQCGDLTSQHEQSILPFFGNLGHI